MVKTYRRLGDAALVGARVLRFIVAGGVGAAFFVRIVAAVIFVIAFPRLEDAASIAASVLDGAASVK